MARNTSEFKITIFFNIKNVDLVLRLVWFVLFMFTLQLATFFFPLKNWIFLSDSNSTVKYLDDMGLQLLYSPEVLAFILDCYWSEIKIYVNKILIQFLCVFHGHIHAQAIQFIVTFKPILKSSISKTQNRGFYEPMFN